MAYKFIKVILFCLTAFLLLFFLPDGGQLLNTKFLGASIATAPELPEGQEPLLPSPVQSESTEQSEAQETPESLFQGNDTKNAEASQPSYQDQLDDIAEKLDVIQQQVAELVAQANTAIPALSEPSLRGSPQADEAILTSADQTTVEIASSQAPRNDENKQVLTNTGMPATKIDYPKILFSEVQIAPIDSRFIELYNPNDKDVVLTGWYLQRKTATSSNYSSFVSKNYFLGETILAQNYFLISRTDQTADIFLDDLTLTENNSFVFKNPNREISDELILTGQNPDATKSLCKLDFLGSNWEICLPTPKDKNQKWVDALANDSGDYFLDSGDYF